VLNADPLDVVDWLGVTHIRNNLLYSTASAALPIRGGNRFSINLETNATSTVGFDAASLWQNNNTHCVYDSNAARQDHSIVWWNGSTTLYSKPGASGTFFTTFGEEGRGTYGSPMFVDSTANPLTMNVRLRFDSAARGVADSLLQNDTGALTYSADSLPPRQVRDLVVVRILDSTGVVLQWTSPTEDAEAGGAATSYDVRYVDGHYIHGTRIQQDVLNGQGPYVDWWRLADLATGEPTPAAAGTLEQFTIAGLQPGRRYTFFLSARDDANLDSTVSTAAYVELPKGGFESPDPVPDPAPKKRVEE